MSPMMAPARVAEQFWCFAEQASAQLRSLIEVGSLDSVRDLPFSILPPSASESRQAPALLLESCAIGAKMGIMWMLLAGLVATLDAVLAQYHIRCQPSLMGNCGDSSRPREINCCDHGYCLPLNSSLYQCYEPPAQCPTQETDVDYYGNDIKTLRGVSPADCCTACVNTDGCAAYTFVNENPDKQAACYLKQSPAGWREKKGAVSAQLQTTAPPSACRVQEINVDYYGNDIKSLANVAEADCCTECGKTAGCRYYTYSTSDKTCYLKSSSAGRMQKIGVVSARVQSPAEIATCPMITWDVDYYGNDIASYRDVKYSDCCDKCSKMEGCMALTFIDDAGDGKSGCYLKSSTSGFRIKRGAQSSTLQCATKSMGACGSLAKGAYCCPDTDFCQPWNPSYYQCIPRPDTAKCAGIEVGIDYFGGDLKSIPDLLVSSCCDACLKEPECRFFTFVNSNPNGHSACYLKKAMGERKPLAGAVSGTRTAA